MSQVASHNNKSDCWVVLHDRVLDVTDFLKDHPGGELAIITFAGKDATAEFDIKKEAAWSISNATSGGSPEQIKYLVSQGCIKPLCDLLTCNDPRLVTVALEGIENVLKAGELESAANNGQNPYTTFVDEAEGLDKLEQMQTHQNEDVYKKAMHILETYFGLDDEEDEQLAPEAGQQGFVFAQGGAPMGGAQGGGYSFG